MYGFIGLMIWLGELVLLFLNAYGIAVPENPLPYVLAIAFLAFIGGGLVAAQADK